MRCLKVDTEGDELAAVRGASGVLASMSSGSLVLVEVDAPRMGDRDASPAELLEEMQGHGYDAHVVANDYSVAAYVHPPQPQLKPVDVLPDQGDVVFIKTGNSD